MEIVTYDNLMHSDDESLNCNVRRCFLYELSSVDQSILNFLGDRRVFSHKLSAKNSRARRIIKSILLWSINSDLNWEITFLAPGADSRLYKWLTPICIYVVGLDVSRKWKCITNRIISPHTREETMNVTLISSQESVIQVRRKTECRRFIHWK